MTIASLAEYRAAYKQTVLIRKDATSWGGTSFFAGFRLGGSPAAVPAPGSTAAGIVPVSPGTGYPTIATFSGVGYIAGVSAHLSSGSVIGFKGFRFVLADILWYGGAYTSASAVTLAAQPSFASRLPGGSYSGLQLWSDGVSNGSTSSTLLNVTYMNQSGTTGKTTGATDINVAPASNVGLQAVQFPLAAGDTGIQKIEVVTGSGGGSYQANLGIMRPLAYGRVARSGVVRAWLDKLSMVQVFPDSALVLIVVCEGSGGTLTTPPFEIAIDIISTIDASLTPPGAPPGTLLVELLFNDGAGNGTALNTGSLGGTFSIAGQASIQASGSGAEDAGGYLKMTGVYDGGLNCNDAHPAALILGTSDFEISAYARFSTYSSRWGQILWGWEYGNPSPRLYVEATTGLLRFGDGTINVNTGVSVTLDSTWRQYKLRRISGVAAIYINNSLISSFAYTSNCNVGFTNGSFRVASDGNGAGGFNTADIDQFRLYA